MRNINIKYNIKSAVRILLLTVLAAFVIISQTGCSNKEPVSRTAFYLNTQCEIKIFDMKKGKAEDVLDKAFSEIENYESILSKTVEGSDVYNINNAGGKAVKVTDDTVSVIELGLQMAELSGGRFDITIGEVTDLWNFTGDNPKVPDRASLQAALNHVDYRNIIVDGNTVALRDPKAQLDLGGVAKGYIADRTAEFLEAKGVERAVVNLGGNVVVIGEKAKDTPWNIGVERPYSDRTELIGAVAVKDATLVTSGIYERKFEQDGVLYHHVLDPDTGFPADSDLEAVTIKAAKGNSGFCDGLSTVCLMLGKDKAMNLVKELQGKYPKMCLEAAFIDKNNDMVQTEGMKVEPIEGK